jgi:hypothetical protein
MTIMSDNSFRNVRETLSVLGYSTVLSSGWFVPNSPLIN